MGNVKKGLKMRMECTLDILLAPNLCSIELGAQFYKRNHKKPPFTTWYLKYHLEKIIF